MMDDQQSAESLLVEVATGMKGLVADLEALEAQHDTDVARDAPLTITRGEVEAMVSAALRKLIDAVWHAAWCIDDVEVTNDTVMFTVQHDRLGINTTVWVDLAEAME